MEFKETYRAEVYQSRKIRSQRALFWAKVTGFALMVTVAASFRASPELRSALMTAGMDGVSQIARLNGARPASAAQAAPGSASTPGLRVTQRPQRSVNPEGAAPLTPDIKVNRFGQTKTLQGVNLASDARVSVVDGHRTR